MLVLFHIYKSNKTNIHDFIMLYRNLLTNVFIPGAKHHIKVRDTITYIIVTINAYINQFNIEFGVIHKHTQLYNIELTTNPIAIIKTS